MNHLLRHLLYLSIAGLFTVTVSAQNISSPYSIVGIGDIETGFFNRNSGMANTGFSLRNGKTLYQLNPASYSALENQFFTFEFATQGRTVRYSGDPVDPLDNSNGDFTFKKVSAGFKITPRWGMGFGLSPFSTVNYQFNLNKNIGGTTSTYQSLYDGNGGINQIYWGNAYRITKNLSVGVNSAYLFGSIKQSENILDANTQSSIQSIKNVYYRKVNFTYGLQYFTALNKTLDYSLGLVFSPQNNINNETSLQVFNNNIEIVPDDITDRDKFTLPATYGIGMSVMKNKRLTIAADYRFQNWSAASYNIRNTTLVNSHRYSAGVDYSKLKNLNGFLYERLNLQAGAFYQNSYLKINGRQVNEYGITVGAGIPVGGRINMNMALEVGSRGTTQAGLIKENYAQVTLNISYRDFWYTKGRKYD